ncbi:uncharacterized protein NECHADRAFT_86863 [Fusarium vanettenii 77-13-4]|uniref:Uncharacterized protein n=1 Tax=Fusarium vanettenii (strain ATCC MYA-4622 / CBS 123669 / FGSC 9596 / NRRL 45880 / 77-13-4) TaxID=660122 RepID=C7ZK12_FUSV7|nr:uncharacterized protein NECHADRAFT_86863 [Fusarium vanettenii 77-13-4]EEU35597.1 hypothetical protein NECHADRAFT_86863 [Fusarium vanettenii 77-13-4]
MSPINLKVEVDNAPDFADDVVIILNSVLAAQSTPVEAAKALDALCTEESDPATFLALFWELFHPLARQIPYDSQGQDLLAAVVQALDELAPRTVTFKAGWGETADHAGPLWKNLRETVAAHFYDTFGDSDLPASGEEFRKQRKLNLNAFAARVTSLLNLSTEMYFLWAMVDGLEGTMTFVWGALDVINEDPAALDEYDIKAAAAWMVHAAHVFYGRDEEVRGGGGGPLWMLPKKEGLRLRRKYKGTDGLCPLRWQLWKERLAVFRDTEALDARLQKEAGDAYAAMEAAETLTKRQGMGTGEEENEGL